MTDAPPRNQFSFRRIGLTLGGALTGTLVGIIFTSISFPRPTKDLPVSYSYLLSAIAIGFMLAGTLVGAIAAHADRKQGQG